MWKNHLHSTNEHQGYCQLDNVQSIELRTDARYNLITSCERTMAILLPERCKFLTLNMWHSSKHRHMGSSQSIHRDTSHWLISSTAMHNAASNDSCHQHTPTHNCSNGYLNTTVLRPFFWDIWVSRCQRELLDFTVQGKINRGRDTDHQAGCHSIRTNQCPPPPSPIFYRPEALPAAQPTVSKHWRHFTWIIIILCYVKRQHKS